MPLSPPRPKLPPLNALRAFEAAARLGGFAQAAEELCVTPAAISQHIRALEAWAGVALFERRARGVRLTGRAVATLGHLTAAFDEIGHGVTALKAAAPSAHLHIAALPGVAQLWLAPRLPGLRRALGDVELSVHALEEPPSLLREGFDLSLFLRPPDAVNGRVLARDSLFPVCAPELAGRIATPDDLSGQVLLHDATWRRDWADWSRQSGAALADPRSGPVYSLYTLLLAEARAGAGVMIGHGPLVAEDLRTGALVRPLADEVPTGRALVAETRPGSALAETAARQLASGAPRTGA